MGAVDPGKRKIPVICPKCGEEIWEPYAYTCNVCFVIAYLEFRHVMNWPLDAQDKRRLGLN
jgi:hypothetical protein